MTDWKDKYLDCLRRTGNISVSAKAARITRQNVYLRLEADADFRAACEDAKEEAADILEEEARRRAYEGTLKPVFQQGGQVGEIREYSDTLLIFMLKGAKPDKYAERKQITGAGGGPIQIKQSVDDLRKLPEAELARVHAETLGD